SAGSPFGLASLKTRYASWWALSGQLPSIEMAWAHCGCDTWRPCGSSHGDGIHSGLYCCWSAAWLRKISTTGSHTQITVETLAECIWATTPTDCCSSVATLIE